MESTEPKIPVDSVVEAITSILSGGTTDNIVRGVLVLILAIGAAFVLRWLKKREIAATQVRNNQRRDTNQSQTDDEARRTAADANQSEDEIEQILED